jgi:hypothetical protein
MTVILGMKEDEERGSDLMQNTMMRIATHILP